MKSDQEMVLTTSPQETARAGETLARGLMGEKRRPHIVCLYGELGSGKTTFAQGFAKGLGITSRLLSPTFIIVRRYQVPNAPDFLYHLDLYRIDGEKDLQGLGISEILAETGSYILVEWAERLGNWLPSDRVDIRFSILSDGNHQVEINSKVKAQMSNQIKSSKFK